MNVSEIVAVHRIRDSVYAQAKHKLEGEALHDKRHTGLNCALWLFEGL